MPRKVFVEVYAHFGADGKITPNSIVWEDGRIYEIDKILDVCRAASIKVGGTGFRYLCKIKGKITYLFYEEPKWFVEAKI